jgi:hypothetical protein
VTFFLYLAYFFFLKLTSDRMTEQAAERVRHILSGYAEVTEEVRDYAANTTACLLDEIKNADSSTIALGR